MGLCAWKIFRNEVWGILVAVDKLRGTGEEAIGLGLVEVSDLIEPLSEGACVTVGNARSVTGIGLTNSLRFGR